MLSHLEAVHNIDTNDALIMITKVTKNNNIFEDNTLFMEIMMCMPGKVATF